MLKEAIIEFKKLKVSEATATIFGAKDNSQSLALLKTIEQNITQYLEPVEDVFGATLLFSEMALRKMGDLSCMATYDYGTLASKANNIPANSKVDARRLRLFALFQNLDKFERLITMARNAPMLEYEGNLNDEEFFDFLLMSDAYQVWDSDNESKLLSSIQRLVKQHEPNHPGYTKARISAEGEKAHKALFKGVEMIVNR